MKQVNWKRILNVRKPAFWLVAAALVVCAAVTVCFLTDPKPSPAEDRAPGIPAVKWFDCLHGDKMNWGEEKETSLEAFPGVVFRWDQDALTAIDGRGETELFTGMPIQSVYFCDLTGDGKPELCGCRSMGSGIVSYDVVVCDYAAGLRAELMDGENYYILNLRSGALTVERRKFDICDGNRVSELRIEEIGSLKLNGTALEFLPEARDPEEARYTFRAELLELGGEAILVRPEAGSAEARSCDQIWVPSRLLLTGFNWPGDRLEIEYDGNIMESYPAQLGEVYSIRTVEHVVDMEAVTERLLPVAPLGEAAVVKGLCLNQSLAQTGTDPAPEGGTRHVPVYKAQTREELEAFCAAMEPLLAEARAASGEPGEAPLLSERLAVYDDAFFADNYLLFAYVETGSGSDRVALHDLTVHFGDNKVTMNVELTRSGRNDGPVAWFVVAELSGFRAHLRWDAKTN